MDLYNPDKEYQICIGEKLTEDEVSELVELIEDWEESKIHWTPDAELVRLIKSN